jgi:hypothetical protein
VPPFLTTDFSVGADTALESYVPNDNGGTGTGFAKHPSAAELLMGWA